MSFYAAGGFVMFPVTVVGAVALGLALRHLFSPSASSANAAATARQALALLALGGSALDLWAVGQAVGSGAFAAEDLVTVAVVGGGEAMAPAAFGLGLAALAAVVATLGDTRRSSASGLSGA
jgi:hypothetical protein